MKLNKSAFPSIRQLLINGTSRNLNERIFFLHIAKSGGTSITQAFQNSYGLSKRLSRRHFFTLSNEASAMASEIIEENIWDYREKLLLYYMSMERMKYIGGHFHYSDRAMQKFGKEWNFVTVLRHPVSRWFSSYFFDKYREGSSHGRIYADLESFLESERGIRQGNAYVLSFTEGLSTAEATSDNAVKIAIENLNKFTLVGILEQLDRFKEDFEERFGVKLLVEQLNKNPLQKSKQQEMISDNIRQRVEEVCQPSLKVYNAMMAANSIRN